MTKRRRAIEKLKQFYKLIPKSNCKGLCQDSCTAVGFTNIEGERMADAAKQAPFLAEDGHCGYLVNDKCSIYSSRPAICRLFGSTEKLVCPFGCEPDAVLSEKTSMGILSAIDKLGDGIMYVNITDDQRKQMTMERLLNKAMGDMGIEEIAKALKIKL